MPVELDCIEDSKTDLCRINTDRDDLDNESASTDLLAIDSHKLRWNVLGFPPVQIFFHFLLQRTSLVLVFIITH